MHAAAAVEGFQSLQNPSEQVEHVLETELVEVYGSECRLWLASLKVRWISSGKAQVLSLRPWMIMVFGIEGVSVVAGDAIGLEYSRLSLHIRD